MKKYLVSSFTPGAKADKKFIKALETFSNYHNAPILLKPTKANYKDLQLDYRGVPEEYIVEEEVRLNSSLVISDMLINHNLVDPISGLESVANAKGSLVVASPRHRFKSVARSLKHDNLPRGIWCTGSVSEPCYKSTKQGLRMKGYHLKGALVITVENNKIFHIRQLTYDSKLGGFHDLDMFYTSSGRALPREIEAISLGDLHPPFVNKNAMKATLKMIKRLRPKNIVFHDTFDASSISHHVEGKHLTKALISEKIPTLDEELRITAKCLKEFYEAGVSHGAKFHIVKSNHDEHLDRYLDEFRFVSDYRNLLVALDLVKQKVKFKMNLADQDSLEFGLTKHEECIKNFNFLERDDKLDIEGVECGNHGDFGPNGARGSAKANGLAFSGNIITGHQHTPEIGVYGNSVNGTMTDLSLPYTNDSGTSGWLHTHTIVYRNGAISHIHLIPGSKHE